MKTLVHCFWLLQVIFCAMAFAESVEVKTISMTVGKSVVEDTNMAIKSYRIEPLTDIIKVSLTGETFLHITANKQGEATIIVNSVGGETKMYAVTVQSTLTTELRKLRNDLEDLPELDINIDEDRIVIKGTVSNSEHWAHFQRVLANNRGGKIVNYAVFRPSTATLTKLQKQLEERGFTFCAPDAVPGPGELLMKLSRVCFLLVGVKLGMRSIPIATACTIYHKFFCEINLDAYDPYLVAMSSLYLAGKVEEQHLRTRDIINVSNR